VWLPPPLFYVYVLAAKAGAAAADGIMEMGMGDSSRCWEKEWGGHLEMLVLLQQMG
jgi:hypothetical protein